jgi:hypothetical protein
MKELIDHVVSLDTVRSKSPAMMRQQECFAIKRGIDGELDAVRKVYMDTIADIYSLGEMYKQQCAYATRGCSATSSSSRVRA